jgi:hypothetical protein
VITTLSLKESSELAALRAFLLPLVADGTEIVRGLANRVPEPRGGDFIVFWPMRQERLGTNLVVYQDNVVTGSIAGTVLTVTAVQNGALDAGMILIDGSSLLAVDTRLVSQLSGSIGGTGAYTVAPGQTIASETMYAGVRADSAATQWTVQLDVHGPSSADNARVIETLFRSEYGTDGLLPVTPLYCEPMRQLAFVNSEQQYEERWSIDAVFQIGPIVGTPQQFATQVSVGTVEVATEFTG